LLFGDILSPVGFPIEPFQEVIQHQVDGVIMRCLEFGSNNEITLPALTGNGIVDSSSWKAVLTHIKGLLAQRHVKSAIKDDPAMGSDNDCLGTLGSASVDQSDSIYNLTLLLTDDPMLVGAFGWFL
jgi:hypothetical protein